MSRLTLGQSIALVGAFGWSVLLLVAGAMTLVEEEGSGILLAVGVPLVATVLVTLALLARGPGSNAGALAWTLVVLLGGFNALALLSIGIFLLPTTVCLLVACGLHNADLEPAPNP